MARQGTAATDKIDFGDNTVIDLATQASWACWVYVDSWSSSDSYARQWTKGGSWVLQRDALGAGTANKLDFAIFWPSQTYVNTSGYTWTEAVWHFVGVVLDRTLSTQRIKMYASLAGASTLTQIGSHDLDATE